MDHHKIQVRWQKVTSIAFGGSIALAAAIGVGRFVYTPILPPMVEALGLSKALAGLIASANFLGYLIGALVAAMPILPGFRRLWLLGALTVSALTTGGMGLTQALPAFLILRFIGGVASAFALILASASVLERLAKTDYAGLSSLHFGGVGIGIAVSAILVAAMLQVTASWQSLWLASGVLSFAATAAVAQLLRDQATPRRHSGGRTAPTDGRGLARIIIAYGLVGFGYVITATFLVAIVRNAPTIRPLEPVIWVVFGVAVVPLSAFWTRTAIRLGIPKTFALACLTEAAGVAVSVVWQSKFGVFLAAILVDGAWHDAGAHSGCGRFSTRTRMDDERIRPWSNRWPCIRRDGRGPARHLHRAVNRCCGRAGRGGGSCQSIMLQCLSSVREDVTGEWSRCGAVSDASREATLMRLARAVARSEWQPVPPPVSKIWLYCGPHFPLASSQPKHAIKPVRIVSKKTVAP